MTIKDLKQIIEDFDESKEVYLYRLIPCGEPILEQVNGFIKDRHGDLRLTTNLIQKEL